MRAASAGLLAATLFVSVPAFAQAPSPDGSGRAASAEDLFQRGKALLTSGDAKAACPLLLESYRLEAAGGTLQNLAICYEDTGRWASAYARFQELRAFSKSSVPPRPDRAKLAEEHIALLTPRLSRIVVRVRNDASSRIEVTVDGTAYVEASAWAAGIVVDPGSHEVVVRAPGKKPFRTTVVAKGEGSRDEVVVPELADESGGVVTQPSTDEAREAGSGRRTTGLVVGAAGLAVLGVGGVFGVLALVKNGQGRDACSATANSAAPRADFDPSGRCYVDTNTANDANGKKDDARTFANLANALVPVGAIAAGVGAYLFLTSDRTPARPVLRVAPTLGGGVVEGSF